MIKGKSALSKRRPPISKISPGTGWDMHQGNRWKDGVSENALISVNETLRKIPRSCKSTTTMTCFLLLRFGQQCWGWWEIRQVWRHFKRSLGHSDIQEHFQLLYDIRILIYTTRSNPVTEMVMSLIISVVVLGEKPFKNPNQRESFCKHESLNSNNHWFGIWRYNRDQYFVWSHIYCSRGSFWCHLLQNGTKASIICNYFLWTCLHYLGYN